MNTQTKITSRFGAELAKGQTVTEAAFATCRGIRDEAAALWGDDTSVVAFHAALAIIAGLVARAAVEVDA